MLGVLITPKKSLFTPKTGKRKGYQARENRNRASMKKIRVDDEDFRKAENESRLKRSMMIMRILIFEQNTMEIS